MELYYKNGEIVRKDRSVAARIETVVMFLPDIRCCVPTRVEWDALIGDYKQKAENIVTDNDGKSLGSGGSGSNKRSVSNSKSTDSETTKAAVAVDVVVKDTPAKAIDQETVVDEQPLSIDTTTNNDDEDNADDKLPADTSNAEPDDANAPVDEDEAITAKDKALAHFPFILFLVFP